jgi:tetratricopeptide (TPR) repeat protein
MKRQMSFARAGLFASVVLAAAACSNPEQAKQEYLESGNQFMAEGRVDEAILQYRNAIRQDSRFGEARWRLAEAHEQSGNAAAALREYVRAADLLPGEVEVQIKAASYLLLSQQFEDARSRAEKALEHHPEHVQALLLRANAMAGLKDVPGAIQEIEDALAAQPPDARLYTSLGALKAMEGEEAEAGAAFERAVAVDPSSIEARLALASFHWAGGRADQVEKALLDARALDETHLMLNRMLTAFYLTTGRAAEAEAPLKHLVAGAGDEVSDLVLADYYTQMGRTDDAVAMLRPMTEGTNPSGPAMLRLAQIERAAGRREPARRMIDELNQREPRNATVLTTLSTWQLADGEPIAALATARDAVAADPESARAHYALGRALASGRQTEEAIKAFNDVLRINPRFAAAQVLLSRLHLATGDANAAARLAADAKREAPDSPDVRLALARSLIAQGELSRAEPEVRSLLADYPQAAASHVVNGVLLMARRNTTGARAAFLRALDRDPASVDALQGLFRLDLAAGSLDAAVVRVDQRLALDGDNVPLLFLAAATYAAAGQPDRAEQSLRSVLALDPNNMTAYGSLGQLYVTQRRLDDALAEFDRISLRQPGHVGAATMAAMIVQIQGREDEARQRYERIVAGSQRAPIAANNLAWIYAERGTNLDEALQLARLAKSQLPDVVEITDTLGWVYYKQNLPHLAVPLFEECVAADPKNASYHLHLGLAHAKAGDTRRATESLQQALRLNPSPADADVARQALAAARN